jgi:2'-hydroxyisoflavone reductase
VGGHRGPVVTAPADWLLAQGMAEFMGPDSLAMWMVDPGWEGWSGRSGAAAARVGLHHRPPQALLADLLTWERGQGLDRQRSAGLSTKREHDLLVALSRAGSVT